MHFSIILFWFLSYLVVTRWKKLPGQLTIRVEHKETYKDRKPQLIVCFSFFKFKYYFYLTIYLALNILTFLPMVDIKNINTRGVLLKITSLTPI